MIRGYVNQRSSPINSCRYSPEPDQYSPQSDYGNYSPDYQPSDPDNSPCTAARCTNRIDDLIKANSSLAAERDRKERIIQRQGSDIWEARRSLRNFEQDKRDQEEIMRRYENDIRDQQQTISNLQLQLRQASKFVMLE